MLTWFLIICAFFIAYKLIAVYINSLDSDSSQQSFAPAPSRNTSQYYGSQKGLPQNWDQESAEDKKFRNQIRKDCDKIFDNEDKTLRISYLDANGFESERTILVREIGIINKNPVYFFGYCFDRKAPRTFRIDRIEEMADAETGEILNSLDFFGEGSDAGKPSLQVLTGAKLQEATEKQRYEAIKKNYLTQISSPNDVLISEKEIKVSCLCSDTKNNELQYDGVITSIRLRNRPAIRILIDLPEEFEVFSKSVSISKMKSLTVLSTGETYNAAEIPDFLNSLLPAGKAAATSA